MSGIKSAPLLLALGLLGTGWSSFAAAEVCGLDAQRRAVDVAIPGGAPGETGGGDGGGAAGDGAAAVRPRRLRLKIPSTAAPVVVDGTLDEAVWGEALKLELAYEVRPGENLCTTIHTEALLVHDTSHVYIGFRAQDPDPGKIRARLSDRDRAFADDFVGIVFDTFNDERRAFEFFVNPLGVQMDLVQDDVSGNEDSSWDAIWDSAGSITESGYQVEMAIPYTSLRFQRGEEDQIWGLDLIRIYPRDQRYQLTLSARDRNLNCYLCQLSKLEGFAGAEPGKNLEVVPTLTAIRTDSQQDFPDGGLVAGKEEYEPGITARWGVTPNLVLAGTVNPDFSQVEADVARLDINEQFALFFPEKRPFFLEGADFFETPLSTVHTRTIAKPRWGSKLTGKEGPNAMGVFISQDELTSVVFPGSQGSEFGLLPDESTTGVLRYRRDVGENSAVGAVFTGREGTEYHNRVLGVDALLRLAESSTLRLQALGSQTRYPDTVAGDFGQPLGDFTDRGLFVSYSHSPRNWLARASYVDLGRDFRSDLGFMPRVDYRQPVVGGAYRWWGEPDDWYTRIEVGGDWDLTEDQNGRLIEREIEGWVTVGGPLQSFLFLGAGHRTRVFREVSFPQDFINYYFEMRPAADFYFSVDGGISKRVDFAFSDPTDHGLARQGNEFSIEPRITYNLGRHLAAELSHELRNLEGHGGTLFEANLTQLRLVYNLNVRAFFRAILQHSDVDRDLGLYSECVTPGSSCSLTSRRRDLFGQLLFSYKVNPQTALYLGYSDTRAAEEEIGLTRSGRTFFFKIGYAWVL